MTSEGQPRRSRIAIETRVALLAMAAGVPGLAAAATLLWLGGYSPVVRWTVIGLLLWPIAGFALAVRKQVTHPLQTLAALLAALREGDYSVRGHSSREGDVLDEVYREVNILGSTLDRQRIGAVEATALLRAVMAEIDVAVFTFDGQGRLRLVNRAGERLLLRGAEELLGQDAASLGLAAFLASGGPRTEDHIFPGGHGRWGIRLREFRENGLPHRLLVIEDLTRTLREEELQAWKRLVRVLGHEFNNSLTPIRSIAGSLGALVEREPKPDDWKEDAAGGLRIIASRAEALTRFLESYARLAKLPPPNLAPVDIGLSVRRVASLESRVPVEIREGPGVHVMADGDQLEQLLINLIRNAADAAVETGGGVEVSWQERDGAVEVWVRDDGPGLRNPANLFVPFYTTKPGGSGVGLVLSRQIAEAHGGTLTLANRADAAGCEAVVRLPAK